MSNDNRGEKISSARRDLVIGALFTFMGSVELWFWIDGFGNRFALWFGVVFCSAGVYFLGHGWRSRRTG